ncbi:MAG: MazG family protein [Eubacteriales bacterium]|nr:MazG family protein [Eubacteriales bacterium]
MGQKTGDELERWEISQAREAGRTKYNFDDLTGIIGRLRAPDGCPWDREQTHESLKPCMTEEAAELLAAIRIYDRTGNAENLCEELGDILLQVMMHAAIAEENGVFSIDDVVNGVAQKMVYRHPHVFGEVSADTSEQVLANWEELKKKEKEGKEWVKAPLHDIPEELPAMARAQKVVKKIRKLYDPSFGAEEAGLAKLEELAHRLRSEELARTQRQEEEERTPQERIAGILGEMSLVMAGIAAANGLSLEQIVRDKTDDLVEKYEPEE